LQNFIKNNLCKVSRRRARDQDRNPSRPRRDLRPSRPTPRPRLQKTGLETPSLVQGIEAGGITGLQTLFATAIHSGKKAIKGNFCFKGGWWKATIFSTLTGM